MKRVLALSALLLAGVAGADVEARYNKSCVFCHGSGAAGAPVKGDQAAWAPRLEKGMDALLQSTRQGVGGMPPGGMCGDCSDDDYRALIEYMSK